MKILLAIVLAAVLLILAVGIYIFNFTFYNSPKKRRDPDSYRSDPFYQDHLEQITAGIDALKTLPCEDVEILSEEGRRLHGRYYEQKPGAPVALLMHGYRGHAFGDFCGRFDVVRSLGFNILLIDERACGDSDGRVISFGIRERKDGLSWINYILCRFGEETEICLFGVSMGAATVMMMLGLEDLPENVKAVVEDCGYTSPRAVIRSVAEKNGFPVDLMYPLCRASARVLGGFDIEAASPIDAVRKTKVPILFIHGEDDDFVPFPMCGELYEACASEKKMLTVPGAGHAKAYLQDGEAWSKAVREFLRGRFHGLPETEDRT